ncbi:MAG: lipopolysaccharide biosynthesis protein [Bacteroidaceae bacterium]|nr:lipopolysaccharide biosynthesis protein [Bacteroidaceae bacterium]
MSDLNNQIVKATKWSSITEIVAKLITPITSILLARLLTPEAFGVVTTLTMVITFAEIFTDAGFQKYLIQHEFKDEVDRTQSTNVAFWSNLVMSLLIWLLIGVFCEPLATMVGNPGLGHVLTIACVSIPLAAFSSIQMALYKRDFDFKTLFKVRIVGICIPLVVTVPLALWLKNYWALVVGTIASNLVNAVLLTVYSKWKPSLYYSFAKLKEMLSFTIWSMIEAVSIWMTSYVDVFIIGVYLNEYYLGLYKTSITVVGQIMGLITAATTPILFSSLSRLQTDEKAFQEMFFKFQKLIGILVIPVGVGIYCFSDLIVLILGEQWTEAAGFIGLWGLTSSITIVLSHYSSEIYRAKGQPKLSVLAQILHLIVLWPVVLIAVKYGFEALYISRSLVRLELILVNLIIMYFVVHISVWSMCRNISASCLSAIIMAFVSHGLLMINQSIWWQVISIIACAIVYFTVIVCFLTERRMLFSFMQKIKL